MKHKGATMTVSSSTSFSSQDEKHSIKTNVGLLFKSKKTNKIVATKSQTDVDSVDVMDFTQMLEELPANDQNKNKIKKKTDDNVLSSNRKSGSLSKKGFLPSPFLKKRSNSVRVNILQQQQQPSRKSIDSPIHSAHVLERPLKASKSFDYTKAMTPQFAKRSSTASQEMQHDHDEELQQLKNEYHRMLLMQKDQMHLSSTDCQMALKSWRSAIMPKSPKEQFPLSNFSNGFYGHLFLLDPNAKFLFGDPITQAEKLSSMLQVIVIEICEGICSFAVDKSQKKFKALENKFKGLCEIHISNGIDRKKLIFGGRSLLQTLGNRCNTKYEKEKIARQSIRSSSLFQPSPEPRNHSLASSSDIGVREYSSSDDIKIIIGTKEEILEHGRQKIPYASPDKVYKGSREDGGATDNVKDDVQDERKAIRQASLHQDKINEMLKSEPFLCRNCRFAYLRCQCEVMNVEDSKACATLLMEEERKRMQIEKDLEEKRIEDLELEIKRNRTILQKVQSKTLSQEEIKQHTQTYLSLYDQATWALLYSFIADMLLTGHFTLPVITRSRFSRTKIFSSRLPEVLEIFKALNPILYEIRLSGDIESTQDQ